jgi:hypothetical protein
MDHESIRNWYRLGSIGIAIIIAFGLMTGCNNTTTMVHGAATTAVRSAR